VGFTDGEEFHDHGLAGFDFDGDFFAGLQAIEKGRSGKDADVGEGLAEFVEFQKGGFSSKVQEKQKPRYLRQRGSAKCE
jgi:hypothetical protein